MQQMQTETLITVEASSEELPAIDAAVRGYIQLLRFVVDPSHDRDGVIAQLRSFQHKYEQLLRAWRGKQHTFTQPDEPPEPAQLISWQVTAFELLAFGSAVVGYLHMLETTRAPAEVRNRMVNHLFAFEQRYIERLSGEESKLQWDGAGDGDQLASLHTEKAERQALVR